MQPASLTQPAPTTRTTPTPPATTWSTAPTTVLPPLSPPRRPATPAGDPGAHRHPGLLICQALGVSSRDTTLIVSMSLVISGIATYVQCSPLGAGC